MKKVTTVKKRIFSLVIALVILLSLTACNPLDLVEEVFETSVATSSTNEMPSMMDTTTHGVSETTTTVVLTTATTKKPTTTTTKKPTTTTKAKINLPITTKFSLKNIPAFSKNAFVEVNDNIPYFTNADYTTSSFERYSPLDSLGRCGVAFACVGTDIMPTEKRGEIGSVKPSGWKQAKYPGCVDSSPPYLYNRCHLIAYELTGENANVENLITGTRYMNISGMLPFENEVADYVKWSKNHVLYRATPIFEGSNLVATGVLLEGYSVEDNGKGICFNVFCYNNQPHIQINYADGSSKQVSGFATTTTTKKKTVATTKNATPAKSGTTYILNTNTKKFHKPGCRHVADMADHNRKDVDWKRDEVLDAGYVPCKVCKP